MALTPEQRRVLATIKQVAAQKGASPKQVKAAIETGIVESNLSNPSGGDADSAGWRQERASLYKDPTNLKASIARFYDETAAVKNRYGRAGDLAAAVQRPAAQYRGRYQQQSGRADQLLGRSGSPASQGAPGAATSTTRTVGAVDNSSARRSAILAFLADDRADPVSFATQINGLADVPGRRVTTTTRAAPAASGARPSSDASTSAKGVGSFGGRKVAAWIVPALEYARQRGWQGTINSGYRSYADQQRIYNSGVRPAAKPGTSNHEFTAFPGGAIDVSDAAQLSHILKTSPYARKLVWAGSKDPVHFSHPSSNGSY